MIGQAHPDLYIGRGQQRLQDGHVAEAADDLSTAIALVPDHGVAVALAAIAATRANDSALQERAIELYRSGSKELLFALGRVGKWYSRPPEASADAGPQVETVRAAFQAFVELLVARLEDDKDRLFWLGNGLYDAQVAGTCRDVLTRYCAKFPGHQDAAAMLIDAVILTCDFDSRERFWQSQFEQLERELRSGQPISIDPFNLWQAGVDFGFFSRVCRRRAMDYLPDDPSGMPRRNGSRSGGRIRLGFVLPNSWFGSCGAMVQTLLPHFDPRRFELFGYALHTNPPERADDFEREFTGRFDRFVPLDGLTPRAAAGAIAEDGVDVALDFSGHHRTTCLPILAYRPAPIQAHLLGWSNIIEAPYVDYVVTDPYYHPKHLRDMTTENFALMPEGAWIYYQPPEATDGADERAPATGPFRFCCFNHPAKIDAETFSAWMDILRGTEDSVLALCHWNLGDAVRNMRLSAQRAGVDPARLVFLPMLSHAEHLRRLRTMDVALDTLRLGGGVTTMDAFWAGVPVVAASTHENYLHACRGAFGCLSMSEEILGDVPGYVARAIELRSAPRTLAAFREKIATRRTRSLMFDPPRFAGELQRLIQEMWDRHLGGAEPATFTLAPAPS